MKPELWLNRADHELSLAQELMNAGSLLWAVSYAHRSVEYALEGLIVMKTGIRPEKGSRMADLQSASKSFLSDDVNAAISDLEKISPLVWQSDLKSEQIAQLTDRRAQDLITGAKLILSWIGEEWEKDVGSEDVPEKGPASSIQE
ncbi:MAG: HEPN domain-containing protein [Methanobacteriota archaeon]